MLSTAQALRLGELATPPDGLGRKRLDEELTQRASVDLRPGRAARAGFVQQNVAVPVDDALGIFSRKCEGKKLVVEAGCLQAELPVVLVDVQQASLGPRLGRGLGFVDGCADA